MQCYPFRRQSRETSSRLVPVRIFGTRLMLNSALSGGTALKNGGVERPHAGFGVVAVIAVAVIAVAAVAMSGQSVQGANAADAGGALPDAQAASAPPSIAFPASVPVGGTGLVTVNYTAAPAALPPGAGGAERSGAVLLLRFPAGIEVASPDFEVYPGPAGMGGSASEFAVFYARKPLPPTTDGAFRTEEIAIRVAGPPAPPRNFVDVHAVGIDWGPPAGSSAALEARGGAVHFVLAGAGGGPAATPAGTAGLPETSRAHRLPASSPDALPAPGRLAAHLEGALPRGADAAAWLAEHASHMPAGYREEVAAAYRALAAAGASSPRGAAGGAAGASAAPPPAFPFPTISSYVYGTLSARGSDGAVRGQAGVSACMYDMGDDNLTLTLLDNLADPSDPRGACTSTNGTGFFDMSVLTLDPTDPLSPVDLRIVFGADASHSRIADSRNGTYELHAATVGNLSDPITGLNVTVPDGHEFRRALWILDTIGSAHARFAAEFGYDAPAADVRWDTASPAASSYNRTSGTVTVGSVHGWRSHHGAEASPASITHVYAQHVLAGLRGDGAGPDCPPYLRIDLPAPQGGCAWRSGWAHFAAAVVQDSPSLQYHHLPVAVDLEAPAYDVGGRHAYGFAMGVDVPGNVAGALWDLYDAPGEPGDSVGGAGAAVWSATAGMRHGDDPSILDFWHAWAGNKGNPSMRGVLALNGIDVPPGAPPALAVANASLAVHYGGTAQVSVNATAAGPAALELAAAAAANTTGRIEPPPAFANLTYRYAGNGTTTALVALAPNASDVGAHLLNVSARTQDGLSSHALIYVNVTDRVPPYFASVPWDVYVEATGSLTAVNATALGVRAHDEADPRPFLSHSPAGPLPLGGHHVLWTATDASNNSAAATMYLTVRDTTPPAFEGVANLTLAFAPGVPPVAAYAVPSAADLVDGAAQASCLPRQGSPIPWGPTTVTCDAGDRSGNYAWAQFVINATRGGALAPPLLAASNTSVAVEYNRTARVEINATAAGPAALELAAAAAANTTGRIEPPPAFANLTYRYAGNGTTTALVALAPNASDVGAHLLNVSARTQDGLSSHALIYVNVTDRVPPYFASVPWDVYVEATGSLTAVNATALGVRAHDEADPRPFLSHSPAGPLPLGGHHVLWTATDASNNSAAATMYLTVRDTTPPAFEGVANLTLAFAPGVPPVAAYAVPSAADLVDGAAQASCLPRQGSPIPWGPTTVTCDAGDRSGNYAWAQFVINATRGGALAPPLLAASNTSVAVEYNRTARVEINATAAGPAALELAAAAAAANTTGRIEPPPAFANLTYRYAGNGTTTALVALAPNASDVGAHLLNVSARTQDGLSSHALIYVNVTDRVPPYFASVPWDIVVEATGSLTAVNATALGVRAHDEAGPRPFLSHSPAGPLPLGGHHVLWTATDASNNSAAATMYLTVRDTTPPAFEGVANLTLAFAPGVPPVAAYAVPSAADLVDGAAQASCLPRQGSPIPWGPTTVTCDAGDRSGNYAWAQFVINATRGGALAPPLLAASNTSVAVEYNRTARVEINATAAGPAALELAASAGATGRIEPPPAFANLTYRYAGNGTTTALVALAPNASDVGAHLLNVSARTQDGLSSHALIYVNVTDRVPPYFASVPWDIVVEATGSLTAVNATALGVRAHDEAGPRPFLSHSPAGPLPLGGHHVLWTATDASNNSAAATMYLTVRDTTPPAFGAAGNLTLTFAPAGQPVARYAAPSATDLVDGAVAARCSPPPGSPIGWGPTHVSCEASDRSGNYAQVGFVINATRGGPQDPPAISAPNHTVRVEYNGTARVEVNATGAGGPAAMDLASVARQGGNGTAPAPSFANMTDYWYDAGTDTTTVVITLSPNVSDVGVHALNVTAASAGGLSNHTVITINVADGVRPVLYVPPAATVEATGMLTWINASALAVRAHDEVDAAPLVRHSPQGPLGLGRHAVTWNATDASGNVAAASMLLTIRDTTPPAFEGVDNLTLAFDPGELPVANYTAPRAVDLVEGEVQALCWPPPNSAIAWGATTVLCLAADGSGNTALARFSINATRR